jgi:MFS family permease
VSQSFGLAYYGAVYGIITLFQDIGLGIGPVFYGYVYDATGTYYWAYVTAVVLLSVAILLILILRPPKLALESTSVARVTLPESK